MLSTFRDQSKDPGKYCQPGICPPCRLENSRTTAYVLDNMNYANNNVNDISIIFKNVIKELKDSEEILPNEKK